MTIDFIDVYTSTFKYKIKRVYKNTGYKYHIIMLLIYNSKTSRFQGRKKNYKK